MASVIVVVLNHYSKHRMISGADVTEKLTVTGSAMKSIRLEISPNYCGYCLNGGK